MIKLGITKPYQLSCTKDFLQRNQEISIPMIASLIREERFSEKVYPYFNMIRIGNTFKRTKENRFGDLDELSVEVIKSNFGTERLLKVHDLASSNGITSCYFYDKLTEKGLNILFQSSDKYTHIYIVDLNNSGWIVVLDSDRNLLQYVGYGFVLGRDESAIDLVNRILGAVLDRSAFPKALRLLNNYLPNDNEFSYLVTESPECRLERFPLVSPKCLEMTKSNGNFVFSRRDLFQHFEGQLDVVRALNILNRDYFNETQLRAAIANVASCLSENGLFIVGRSHDKEDKEHNVSIFRKNGDKFALVIDYLKGAEIKNLVLSV